MKARSTARELALFILFQLDRKGGKFEWDKVSFQEIIVNTVRLLRDLAQEEIESVAHEVLSLRNYLIDYEMSHPDNEYIPIESPTLPVPIPTTKEMVSKLDNLLNAVENLEDALYLPEINALSEREDVRNYSFMLVKNVLNHQEEIDRLIDSASSDWRVERIQKMDLLLLRLAVAELKFTSKVGSATVIDESMELAKRFTTDESRKFINGVLGSIAQKPVEAVKDA